MQYVLNRARLDQGYHWWLIRSGTRAIDWCQNQLVPKSMNDFGLPWRAITQFQNMRFRSPTQKFEWRYRIDPYYPRRRCRSMTRFWQYKVIYADIRWEGASNDNGVIEKIFFGLSDATSSVCLPYYIVLFSPSSPCHWPQNTRPWMTYRVRRKKIPWKKWNAEKTPVVFHKNSC